MWIKVEERYPSEEEEVYMYSKVSGIIVGSYKGYKTWATDMGYVEGVMTHWQPWHGQTLPEIPKD